jgi:hypothetical protein
MNNNILTGRVRLMRYTGKIEVSIDIRNNA